MVSPFTTHWGANWDPREGVGEGKPSPEDMSHGSKRLVTQRVGGLSWSGCFLGTLSGARNRTSGELQSLKPKHRELLCGVLLANGGSTYHEKPIFPRARLTLG